MLNKRTEKQGKLITTTLESLMPQEHFLRDLEKFVDFKFIYDKVESLYSPIGRPSIDPVVLVKMLLIGFLFGIDSERKLIREIEVNIAYRWFLGIDLDETIPNHSTISQTRRRKWNGRGIFEEIFAEVVKKCIKCGLVDGKLLLTDTTHVRANASNERKEVLTVTIEPREYLKKLDTICGEEDLRKRAEAMNAGHKKRGYKTDKTPKTRDIVKSTTDPDCGVLNRPGKPYGFHYLAHETTDGKSGIITDVYVTPANTEDFEPYVSRIKRQIEVYGFEVKDVGIDGIYDCEEIHKEMHDLGVKTYIPPKDTALCAHSSSFPVSIFEFDESRDIFICPNGSILKYSHVNKSKRRKIYRASQKNCKNCPLKEKCIGEKTKSRTLDISFFKRETDIQRANFGTDRYYEVQRKRRIYCEGNFAVQKDNHNLRRTRKRGNELVTEHCFFSAMALNLKKLVKHLKDKRFTASLTTVVA